MVYLLVILNLIVNFILDSDSSCLNVQPHTTDKVTELSNDPNLQLSKIVNFHCRLRFKLSERPTTHYKVNYGQSD
jgi:hypothetical protein